MTGARFQRRIQRYGWDRAAECYEDSWRRQIEPAQDLLMSVANVAAGERVTDVACGTGLVTFKAASLAGGTGMVEGNDISEGMVEAARVEAERRGTSNVRFARMDAEKLEYTEGCFDAALCSLGLMYFPEPVESLREMLRVLRPGGRAVGSVWGARKNCGWAGIFPVVDARVQSEVCPMFFQLGTGEALRLAFEDAGFREVRTERISTVLEYADEEEACAAAFAGGPVALAYSRFDERTREEAHAEYLESIEKHRNGSGYRVPGEFVVVRGEKAG